MTRYWLWLWFAGISEVGWVSGLKYADAAGEWLLTALGIAFSFGSMIYVSKVLPVGTVYAVFTGIGAAGAVLAESAVFGAPFAGGKMALVILLVIGIAGLKMTTPAKSGETGEGEAEAG